VLARPSTAPMAPLEDDTACTQCSPILRSAVLSRGLFQIKDTAGQVATVDNTVTMSAKNCPFVAQPWGWGRPTCSSATSLCHVLLGRLRCFLMAPLSAEQAASLAWPVSDVLVSETAWKARSNPSKQSRQVARAEVAMLHGRPAVTYVSCRGN